MVVEKNVSIPERFFDNHYVLNAIFIRTINSLENRKEAYIISNTGHCKAIYDSIAILIPKFCMQGAWGKGHGVTSKFKNRFFYSPCAVLHAPCERYEHNS